MLQWAALLPLAACGALAGPVARGWASTRALELRVATSKRRLLRRLVLARGLHRPLYGACAVLLLLRAAFCLLVALGGNVASSSVLGGNAHARVAYFWLLDTPSVVFAALHGYVALFAVQLACGQPWTASWCCRHGGSSLSIVFLLFCAALAGLTTLMAICRGLGGERCALVPHAVASGYAAMLWSALGLLLLKGQAEMERMARRQRLRQPWGLANDQEPLDSNELSRLGALEASCLRRLGRSSALLALLLVARGILSAAMALQPLDKPDTRQNPQGEQDEWLQLRTLTLNYCMWELTSIALVLRLLREIPIAVHYRVRAVSNGVEGPARPPERLHDGISVAPEVSASVHFAFHVPSVAEVVNDYVLTPTHALFQHQRCAQDWGDADETRRQCVHDPEASSVGVAFATCRCDRHRERTTDEQFLTSAHVPLLADEYHLVDDARPAATVDDIFPSNP